MHHASVYHDLAFPCTWKGLKINEGVIHVIVSPRHKDSSNMYLVPECFVVECENEVTFQGSAEVWEYVTISRRTAAEWEDLKKEFEVCEDYHVMSFEAKTNWGKLWNFFTAKLRFILPAAKTTEYHYLTWNKLKSKTKVFPIDITVPKSILVWEK